MSKGEESREGRQTLGGKTDTFLETCLQHQQVSWKSRQAQEADRAAAGQGESLGVGSQGWVQGRRKIEGPG